VDQTAAFWKKYNAFQFAMAAIMHAQHRSCVCGGTMKIKIPLAFCARLPGRILAKPYSLELIFTPRHCGTGGNSNLLVQISQLVAGRVKHQFK